RAHADAIDEDLDRARLSLHLGDDGLAADGAAHGDPSARGRASAGGLDREEAGLGAPDADAAREEGLVDADLGAAPAEDEGGRAQVMGMAVAAADRGHASLLGDDLLVEAAKGVPQGVVGVAEEVAVAEVGGGEVIGL